MVKLFLALLLVSSISKAAFIDEIQAIQSGTWTVQQGTPPWSFSLPTGAATSANQTTANASLSSIDSKLTSPLAVTGTFFQATQPISAASLPLPSGAATAANQTTANTSLASIDTKIPALISGRQPVDGSGVTQPISAAGLPLPTGASTAANQVTAQTSLTSIDDKLSLPSFVHINTAATTVVKSGAGFLYSICLNSVANGTSVTVYNNTAGSGSIIALPSPPNGAVSHCLNYQGLQFSTGLTIVTNTTSSITIVYR